MFSKTGGFDDITSVDNRIHGLLGYVIHATTTTIHNPDLHSPPLHDNPEKYSVEWCHTLFKLAKL